MKVAFLLINGSMDNPMLPMKLIRIGNSNLTVK